MRPLSNLNQRLGGSVGGRSDVDQDQHDEAHALLAVVGGRERPTEMRPSAPT